MREGWSDGRVERIVFLLAGIPNGWFSLLTLMTNTPTCIFLPLQNLTIKKRFLHFTGDGFTALEVVRIGGAKLRFDIL